MSIKVCIVNEKVDELFNSAIGTKSTWIPTYNIFKQINYNGYAFFKYLNSNLKALMTTSRIHHISNF